MAYEFQFIPYTYTLHLFTTLTDWKKQKQETTDKFILKIANSFIEEQLYKLYLEK